MKPMDKYVCLSLSLAFLFFFDRFVGFALDVCKGRISPDTFQISLKVRQHPSLDGFLSFDPSRSAQKLADKFEKHNDKETH